MKLEKALMKDSVIDETFLHISGIGPKTEAKLKQLGIINWGECLKKKELLPFTESKKSVFISKVEESIFELDKNNIRFFVNNFPKKEHWRILGKYFYKTTFFDIETTGISKYEHDVTVIVAYKEGKIYSFISNENLDDFLELADSSELLASFNGNAFDIPFLEQTFHIPSFNAPHIDLRWVFYHAGFKGGLKSIEKGLNIERPEDLKDVDGYEAVILYYKWQSGDITAKDKLMNYCKADVIASCMASGKILKKLGYDVDESDLFNLI